MSSVSKSSILLPLTNELRHIMWEIRYSFVVPAHALWGWYVLHHGDGEHRTASPCNTIGYGSRSLQWLASLDFRKVRGCCKSHSKILGLSWGHFGVKRDLSSKFSSPPPLVKVCSITGTVLPIKMALGHHEASRKLRFATGLMIFSANGPMMWRRYTTKRQLV